MKTLYVRLLRTLAVLVVLLAAAIAANPAAARISVQDTGSAAPAVQSNCSYDARYVADVTIPDDTVLAPGAAFTKIWRIRNAGTCTWGSAGYALNTLTFVGGTQLANSGGVPLPPRVDPGQEFDISIPMVAAIYPGRWISQWKLQLSDGSLIGFGYGGRAPIYVQIIVSGNEAPQPPRTPPSAGICSHYVVQYGDYLKSIAARFGTTWEAIAQANRLANPNFLYAGMRLAIPCNGTPPWQGPQVFTSALYGYSVHVPSGWTFKVNTSVPAGPGWSPEYATFSAPGSALPAIDVDVQSGTPPFTGFENCDKNMVFRGILACSLSQGAGQNPAQKLLIFQRGSAYFHIALRYQDPSALAIWDSFLSSFQFH